jgi:DNA-binding transcriptional MerR regulator
MSLSSESFHLTPELDRGLYPISVVTELTGIEPHTLRGYERAGLLTPLRTDGGSRRYSANDLARLRRIVTLSGLRVNLEGIRRIMLLEQEVAALKDEIVALRSQAEAAEG